MAFTVRKTPTAVSAGGKELRSNPTRVKVPTGASSAEFAPGSFMKLATGGCEAFVDADTVCAYQVEGIYDKNGQQVDWQYVSSTASAANDYWVDVIPVGGVDFVLGEDADGGSLLDSNVGDYVDLIVAAITDTSGNVPYGRATANIQINSSSAASSSSGAKVWQLIECTTPGVRAAGTPREWRVRILASAAQATL